jgi:hypothetical protein
MWRGEEMGDIERCGERQIEWDIWRMQRTE